MNNRFRHYKGEVYILLIGDAKLEADGTIVCVYQHEETGNVYVRPRKEFEEMVANPKGADLIPRFQLVTT